MRKFIVKRFALDYMCKAFGRIFFFPRASAIMYPLCLFIIPSVKIDWEIDDFGWYEGLLTSLLGVGIYLTFFYFKFKPFKIEELDMEQTYQYEVAIKKKVIKFTNISTESMEKIFQANTFVKENIENRKNYKIYRLIYHPITALLLSGLITYLYYLTK